MKIYVLISLLNLGFLCMAWGQSQVMNQNKTQTHANMLGKSNISNFARNNSELPILKSVDIKKIDPLQNRHQLRNGGVVNGGGGDLCEDRIKTIRNDIKSWIENNGSDALLLPSGMTSQQYKNGMLEAISKAKIKCVASGDRDYPVEVHGAAKVCKFRALGKNSQITCDFNKFQSMTESDQYILIHHEYAGIAGLENPDGSESFYDISNQITEYLIDQVVKRLAIKKPNNPNEYEEVSGARAVQLTEMLILALKNTNFKKSNCEYTEQKIEMLEAECETGIRTEVRFIFTLPINAVRTQILRDPYSHACKSFIRPVPEKLFLTNVSNSPALIARGNSYLVNNMPGFISRYIETKYHLNFKGDKVQSVVFNVIGEKEINVGSIQNPEFKRVGEIVERHACTGME